MPAKLSWVLLFLLCCQFTAQAGFFIKTSSIPATQANSQLSSIVQQDTVTTHKYQRKHHDNGAVGAVSVASSLVALLTLAGTGAVVLIGMAYAVLGISLGGAGLFERKHKLVALVGVCLGIIYFICFHFLIA